MLLNPLAAKRLKEAMVRSYHPFTTHARRNELVEMFLEQEGRLLDQKAESVVKQIVEKYSKGDISYEEYIDSIEHVSNEEAVRGAAYGGVSARNRVFDFAQKALENTKDRVYALSLADAKKQYEIEKQKTGEHLKGVIQQYLSEVQAITQQHDVELKAITQEQKEALLQDQEHIVEQTKVTIEQIISRQLEDERKKREQEIQEEEALRPAREAVRAATERVVRLEKQIRSHRRMRRGLVIVGFVFLAVLLIILLFFSVPQWSTVVAIAVIASVLVMAYLWKSPIPIEKVATHQREIALFQTRSGDYDQLSEEKRCALLVQRIG